MTTGDPLSRLQDWYLAQCDGEWEHRYGVTLGTLDNPGWLLKIDLTGTGLESRAIERRETHREERDWLVYWVDDEQWQAACGPLNLGQAIDAFLAWAG
jgi:hypothetical protein